MSYTAIRTKLASLQKLASHAAVPSDSRRVGVAPSHISHSVTSTAKRGVEAKGGSDDVSHCGYCRATRATPTSKLSGPLFRVRWADGLMWGFSFGQSPLLPICSSIFWVCLTVVFECSDTGVALA